MKHIKLFLIVISSKVLICAPISVANGGTGVVSDTAYAVLCGGITSTGSLQSVASLGTSGQALISSGAGALPTFGTLGFAGGGTGATSLSAGVIQSDSSVLSSLGIGSANQVLFNSTGAAVGWAFTGMLQIVSTNTTVVVDTTSGTSIPDDDTPPQITEGTQILSLAITPKSASSTLLIKFFVGGSASSSSSATITALFVDSVTDALAAAYLWQAATSYGAVMEYVVASGSTTTRTYSVRIGGGSFRVNANASSAARFGGVASTYLIIMEYI